MVVPLTALKDLTDLRLMYVGPADISCLVGLPLERLEIHGGSFEDLSVLPSMPLRFLGLHSLSPSSQEALDFTILRGMKLGMLPRRSSRVCSLTAPLAWRNFAHGNNARQRSMVVESSA